MIFLMSNSEVIQTLINQINSNTDHYLELINSNTDHYLELIFFGLGVFGLLQWHISNSHLKKIKEKMESELEEKYSLSKLNDERKNFSKVQSQVKRHESYVTFVINQKVSLISQSFTDLLTTFGTKPDDYYANQIISALKYIFGNSFIGDEQKISAMLMVEKGFNDAERFKENNKVKPIKDFVIAYPQTKEYYEKLAPFVTKVRDEMNKHK